MKTAIITYIAFAIVYEAITVYVGWKKLKKQFAGNEMIMMIKQGIMQSAQGKMMKKIIFSPPTFIFAGIAFIIASPLMLPFSVWSHVKKLLGYKSKLQKQAESETKAMEEAKKQSDEFMKTEGRGISEEPIIIDDEPDAPPARDKKPDYIQSYNPLANRYVKIDRANGFIISTKKTPGPYKNIPIVDKESHDRC